MANTSYISTRDAAAKLPIGASTLKKLCIHGSGPSFHRIGRRVVYSTDILDECASWGDIRDDKPVRASLRGRPADATPMGVLWPASQPPAKDLCRNCSLSLMQRTRS